MLIFLISQVRNLIIMPAVKDKPQDLPPPSGDQSSYTSADARLPPSAKPVRDDDDAFFAGTRYLLLVIMPYVLLAAGYMLWLSLRAPIGLILSYTFMRLLGAFLLFMSPTTQPGPLELLATEFWEYALGGLLRAIPLGIMLSAFFTLSFVLLVYTHSVATGPRPATFVSTWRTAAGAEEELLKRSRAGRAGLYIRHLPLQFRLSDADASAKKTDMWSGTVVDWLDLKAWKFSAWLRSGNRV